MLLIRYSQNSNYFMTIDFEFLYSIIYGILIKGNSYKDLKRRLVMLAKVTSKNQLTIPKSIISDFPDTKYFEVSKENGRIVLTPVNLVTFRQGSSKIDRTRYH